MILTLEPTADIHNVEGVRCRVWKGQTGDGVPVLAWVKFVQPHTHDARVNAQFASQLEELPRSTLADGIDLRLIV